MMRGWDAGELIILSPSVHAKVQRAESISGRKCQLQICTSRSVNSSRQAQLPLIPCSSRSRSKICSDPTKLERGYQPLTAFPLQSTSVESACRYLHLDTQHTHEQAQSSVALLHFEWGVHSLYTSHTSQGSSFFCEDGTSLNKTVSGACWACSHVKFSFAGMQTPPEKEVCSQVQFSYLNGSKWVGNRQHDNDQYETVEMTNMIEQRGMSNGLFGMTGCKRNSLQRPAIPEEIHHLSVFWHKIVPEINTMSMGSDHPNVENGWKERRWLRQHWTPKSQIISWVHTSPL